MKLVKYELWVPTLFGRSVLVGTYDTAGEAQVKAAYCLGSNVREVAA